GLELEYDELLTGSPGEMVIERDPNGRTIPAGRHHRTPAVPGDDLVLTLDRALQYYVEQALAAQVERMGAKAGIAIVMNPANGEVLALANIGRAPAADGTQTGPPIPIGNNRALTEVFEPGSANKVITVTAALEEGIVEPSTVLTVPDNLQVADHRFTDHDPHPTGEWSVTEIMARSSNIGTIMLGQELGKERLDEYMRRFGFGETTGLGFPSESAGLLLDPDNWSGTSIGTIPLGQGISVTAMQLLSAYNVIANGGVYVAPKLVGATVDEHGTQEPAPPAERRRVVSETTAHAVRDMMVAVVEHGTGTAAAIEGYHVAGKTGTARKPLPEGGYRDAAGNYHYVATFAGFVPAENPQLSVIVEIDEPSATIFASGASAPLFADISTHALRMFRIPPPAAGEQLIVPELSGEIDPNAASDVAGGRRNPPPTTVEPVADDGATTTTTTTTTG
ncbi:MAG: peptidoglycan D,D-transpeptidase FtsI family protein, partial [Acidimicrobiales bacterium]